MNADRVVVWLVPHQPDRGRLAVAIAALAARFGQHAFVPHITLARLTDSGAERRAELTAAAAAAPPDFAMTVLGLRRYPELRRSLVLDLAHHDEHRALRERLAEVGGVELDEPPPHLSLLYRPVSDDELAEVEGLLPPTTVIRFGRVALMRVRASAHAIEPQHWRELP